MPPTLLPTTQIAVSNEPPEGAGNCHGTTDLSTHSALSDEQCTNFAIFMQNAVRARTAPGRSLRPHSAPIRRPIRPNSAPKIILVGGSTVVPPDPSHDAPTRAPTHAPTPCPTAPLVGPRPVRPVRPGTVLVGALAALTLLLPRSHVVDSKGYGPGTTWMGRSRECSRGETIQ